MSATKSFIDSKRESGMFCDFCGTQLDPAIQIETTIGTFCSEECADLAQEHYHEELYEQQLQSEHHG